MLDCPYMEEAPQAVYVCVTEDMACTHLDAVLILLLGTVGHLDVGSGCGGGGSVGGSGSSCDRGTLVLLLLHEVVQDHQKGEDDRKAAQSDAGNRAAGKAFTCLDK